MGRLREQAKKYREIGKEHAKNPDAPAVADNDGEHAEWVKIGMLLLCKEIGKPLRHCEDYLNEMPAILDVFGLEKSPDHTSFWNWDKEFSTRRLRSRQASRVPQRLMRVASSATSRATITATVLTTRFGR